MKKTAYISFKISGEPDLGRAKSDAIASSLKESGYNVINPLDLFDQSKLLDWEQYLRHDVSVVATDIDVLYLADDWKLSEGASVEVLNAVWLGIPVIEFDTRRLMNDYPYEVMEVALGFFNRRFLDPSSQYRTLLKSYRC